MESLSKNSDLQRGSFASKISFSEMRLAKGKV